LENLVTSFLSENLCIGLPLLAQGQLEKLPDWVGLWEDWAIEGSSVLLESAGVVGEASEWLILAGMPEKEYFESGEKFWLSDDSGLQPTALNFWDFTDSIGSGSSHFLRLPFSLASSWFGVLSYEFGFRTQLGAKKRLRRHSKSVPDFYFFKPSRLMAVNRRSKEYFLFGRRAFNPFKEVSRRRNPFGVQALQARWSLEDYRVKVQGAQAYIQAGDIYQANLAQSFQARWEGGAGSLYRLLREMNPGPFMGIFKGRDFTVISSSPERLLSGEGNRLETRPIAGTRPRGKDETQDLQLQVELKTNPKEQAEHLMLVDLARNDLGRVARYGTVEVKRYAEVESYARVHHLVSTVQAQRRESAVLSDVLKALFPGGTITGCPKIRCMEIIHELEGRPRGFYTGSMGYMAPGPCFDLNILIRSFTLFSDGLLEFHAGAGIVADSDPQREYMETLYKVEALAQALGTSLMPSA
jgi:anthranilate/para-aminobenzoate synthase component I